MMILCLLQIYYQILILYILFHIKKSRVTDGNKKRILSFLYLFNSSIILFVYLLINDMFYYKFPSDVEFTRWGMLWLPGLLIYWLYSYIIWTRFELSIVMLIYEDFGILVEVVLYFKAVGLPQLFGVVWNYLFSCLSSWDK